MEQHYYSKKSKRFYKNHDQHGFGKAPYDNEKYSHFETHNIKHNQLEDYNETLHHKETNQKKHDREA